jgi:flagellar hook capping protein FlgD
MSRRLLVAVGASLISIVTGVVPARGYDPITWHTFDGGGVSGVAASSYTFGGTIGQSDAGTLSGGNFTLRGGFWIGGGAASVIGIGANGPPEIAFRFYRATPNPVRSRSRIAFDLPVEGRARLWIHDVAGRVVRIEDWGTLSAGHQVRTWNAVESGGRPLSSGVYFLRLEAGRERAVQKVLVIR